jgi:hypothetical protein
MPLYIPEPIFDLSKQMQQSATKTFGLKPSGKTRALLHQKDLQSLRTVVRHGRDLLKAYLMRGQPISDADIEMAKDRLRAYRGLRGLVLDRIAANRNNARRGVYRYGNHLVTAANTHLGTVSLASKGLDMLMNEIHSMVQSMPNLQLKRQLPNVPRRINAGGLRRWAESRKARSTKRR